MTSDCDSQTDDAYQRWKLGSDVGTRGLIAALEPQAAAKAADAWTESARAYIEFQDRGDPNRTILLDPIMIRLCGDVKTQRVLDLGCGEGRFCRSLGERGAGCIGIDPIAEMTQEAKRRDVTGGQYVRSTAEVLPLADESIDLAVSYVTLVDIPDFRAAIRECARVLRPGGRLLVANLGFVTASLGWQRDDAGQRLYHRLDRYAEEWTQVYEWLGIRIVNWHRPLDAYMRAYLGAGLILRQFIEPVPEDQSLRDDPWFEDWFRVPIFNVMLWEKPAR